MTDQNQYLCTLQASDKGVKAKVKRSSTHGTAAGQKKKQKQVVLSSSEAEEEEEEEEESSSDDDCGGAEIERVLHGRPGADSKEEEFLVKFKGKNCIALLHAARQMSAQMYAIGSEARGALINLYQRSLCYSCSIGPGQICLLPSSKATLSACTAATKL